MFSPETLALFDQLLCNVTISAPVGSPAFEEGLAQTREARSELDEALRHASPPAGAVKDD